MLIALAAARESFIEPGMFLSSFLLSCMRAASRETIASFQYHPTPGLYTAPTTVITKPFVRSSERRTYYFLNSQKAMKFFPRQRTRVWELLMDWPRYRMSIDQGLILDEITFRQLMIISV